MQYKQPVQTDTLAAHAPTHCLNCEAPLAPDDHFCAHCGQKSHLHRLSIGHILHDGLHFFLHADKSILTLVKQLATQTGSVAREFIQGKRKKYFSPLNFYLIVAGIMVFSISIFKPMQKENEKNKQKMQAVLAKIPDPAQKAAVAAILKRQEIVSVVPTKYSNILMMCALPLLSAIFYLFYRREGFNYAEHLVANLYGMGFTSLFMALVATPIMSQFNANGYFIVLCIYFAFEFIYRSIFYVRLFNKQGAAAYIKSALVALFSMVLWVAITASLIFWYLLSGMSGLFA